MSLWLRRRDLRTHLYIATVIKFLATYVYFFLIFFLIFLLDFIIVMNNLIQPLAAILIRINYLSIYLSVRKLLRHCGGKTRHVILELSFAQESRNCVVVRSRGGDRVCRLSVDHWNFTRIDVDEFFKCRIEYRILKYEHVCVKKYTFK